MGIAIPPIVSAHWGIRVPNNIIIYSIVYIVCLK